jgi:hypothetical protein
MHLFYITCAVTPTVEKSVFSSDVRLLQIVKSIESVRKQVANPFIVLLETGSATEEQKSFLEGLVDFYMTINVTSLVKSRGEATMIYTFLSSPWFQENKDRFETFSKLSGRYFLLDSFDMTRYPLDKIFIRFRWFTDGEGVFETRYYRIPRAKIDEYVDNMNKLVNTHYYIFKQLDVEHIYFLCNYFPLEDTIYDHPIGLGGWGTGDGRYFEE